MSIVRLTVSPFEELRDISPSPEDIKLRRQRDRDRHRESEDKKRRLRHKETVKTGRA